MKLKIAQFGLGPIGIESLKLAATKPWAEIIGGIDIDPAKIGRDLGELSKSLRGRKIYASMEDLPAKPDVVLHTSVSKFKAVYSQIEPMARRGISVVSSCEELLFPQLLAPELATKLDKVCKRGGARVIGTGVNPGFVMDLLPVCMTGVSRTVRAVHVQRVVNASTRRGPLQRKIGSGLPPAEFRRLFKAGKAGHAGLKESLALIAHCLGWKATGITETGDAVVAKRDIRTKQLSVKKGQTCGLHQRGRPRVAMWLKCDDDPAIELTRGREDRTDPLPFGLGAHDAMAWNGNRDRVRCAGVRYGAHRFRRTDAPGDLRIARRRAGRNLAQRLPDTLLEDSAAHVEGEIETDPGRLNDTDNACDQSLIVAIAANETRLREAILKIADELVWVVAQQDRGNTLLARGDEDGAE
jgi:4-hydroxy-tetrahydrodipicolinate reductase